MTQHSDENVNAEGNIHKHIHKHHSIGIMAAAESENDKVGAGILIRTLKKGTGTTHPQRGDYCLVHYEGFLEDGTLLDSSRARQQPLKFKVGAGLVMEGWEVAMVNLVEGQEVEVTIPHLYAYGEQGYPPKIPPRSTLIFKMELLLITHE